MTVSVIITTVSSYIFLSFVTNSGGETAGGIFQAGYTIVIRYPGIIFSALSMEFFPRVVKVATRPRMTSVSVSHEILLISYLLTPFAVMFMAAANLIIETLYSAEFIEALPFVLVGFCSTIFRIISYCMAYVIIARGDGRVYIVTELASSLLGLTLNITMYHFFGFSGLGFSYVIWFAVYTLMVGYVFYRRYGMSMSAGSIKASAFSMSLTLAALALRSIAWWAVLPLLIPAFWFALTGYRRLFPAWKR